MNRAFAGALAIGLLTGCGDLKYDDTVRTPAGPPGSTLALGAISALVDGQQFTAPLQTPAIFRNENLGFAAASYSGSVTQTIALSARLAGPGTYTVGSQNSPVVSFLQQDGGNLLRWTSTFVLGGAGSVTLTFLTAEAAGGEFNFELVPDSATKAAGFTAKRYVTGGVFNVVVQR